MPRGVANPDTQVVSRAQEMRDAVACPKAPKGCGQPKGKVCKMPSGARYDVGHGARWDAWFKLKRRQRAALLKAHNASAQER